MRTVLTPAVVGLLVASTAQAGSPKDVYKKASPAVVLILGSDTGKTGSGGTGSIIAPEGKVITNAHVVINATGSPYRTLYVFLKPPKVTGDNSRDLVNRYRARVLAFSPANQLDLALLQIENPPPNLPTVAFADPDKVEIGDEVVAIGHPENGGLWTLTTGAISTVIANFNRVRGKNVFQTEASVNRGNSGGPLLDGDANMVGINTAIARQGAGGLAITDVNFSLKSSVAVSWLAGQGMGLAYAPKTLKQKVVLAIAPQADKPATRGTPPAAVSHAQADTTAVAEPPAATIVIAEAPPPKPEQVRSEGVTLGTQESNERLVSGKPLDVTKAKPKIHTKKRPYNIDELRKQQMKELEDMMDEMRGKIRKKSGEGMGLW